MLPSSALLALEGCECVDLTVINGVANVTLLTDGCPILRAQGRPCGGCRVKDRRPLRVVDLPWWGVPTRLTVHYVRRACILATERYCGELPPGLSRRWKMTLRLGETLAIELLERPLAEVARRYGLSRRWLGRFWRALLAELAARYQARAATNLGLDEAHVYGRRQAVLVDAKGGRLITLLRTNSESAVAATLAGLTDAQSVRVVVIDLHAPYRRAVAIALPHALLVIDKRHVLELVRRRLIALRETLRGEDLPRAFARSTATGLKRERLSYLLSRRWPRLKQRQRVSLQEVFDRHPRLGEAYWLKERFYAIYDHKTRADAEAAYEAWVNSIPPRLKNWFGGVAATITRWREPIFNYFDSPDRPTNAAAEAANREIKGIAREGRGNLHFSALTLKALFRLGGLSATEVRAAARWIVTTTKPEQWK